MVGRSVEGWDVLVDNDWVGVEVEGDLVVDITAVGWAVVGAKVVEVVGSAEVGTNVGSFVVKMDTVGVTVVASVVDGSIVVGMAVVGFDVAVGWMVVASKVADCDVVVGRDVVGGWVGALVVVLVGVIGTLFYGK